MTPFIASVQLVGEDVSNLTSAAFSIAAKPAAVSAPVSVVWSAAVLRSRGYYQDQSIPTINLPVFGLYQGYQNQVTFQLVFNDGSTQLLETEITTEPYVDATGVYLDPTIVKPRAPGSTLGFNYFLIKSDIASPVVVDTDGELRWVVPASPTFSVYFGDGQFFTGSGTNPSVVSIQMDGTQASPPTDLPQPLLYSFTHNIDQGPQGLLAEFNGTDEFGSSLDDIVSEIAPFSGQAPYATFDMADVISNYMLKNGDDPTAFVRPGADWFHMNSSVYDPSDNSIIISSRENFLIKLDYKTGDILWILGDPTKYWYSFPSLRAKALALAPGGDYPIGQHAVVITSEGYIMVFNDGYGSLNQPVGQPGGQSRTYSEVSVYSVNATAMTASQVWKFDYGQTIYSPVCGSSYESPGRSYLVDFAAADNYQEARLVGLDADHKVVFDFEYNSPFICAAAWNAVPIPFENLQIN